MQQFETSKSIQSLALNFKRQFLYLEASVHVHKERVLVLVSYLEYSLLTQERFNLTKIVIFSLRNCSTVNPIVI